MKFLHKIWRKYVLIDYESCLSDEEIRTAYARQRDQKDWTLYNERAFIEGLMTSRFNYFIAAFSLLTTVISRIEESRTQIITVFVSACILSCMGLALYRVYVKLIILLRMIYRLEDYQVFNLINREVRNMHNRLSIPANAILGIVIPLLGCVCYWIYFIVTCICCYAQPR